MAVAARSAALAAIGKGERTQRRTVLLACDRRAVFFMCDRRAVFFMCDRRAVFFMCDRRAVFFMCDRRAVDGAIAGHGSLQRVKFWILGESRGSEAHY